MSHRLTSTAFLAVSALFLVQCGGDSSGPRPPVATVTVTPNPVNVAVASTVQLTATLKDGTGATLTGRTVAWSSEATSVATVDQNGLVTGLSVGAANITATSEGVTGGTGLVVGQLSPFGAWLGPGGKSPRASIGSYWSYSSGLGYWTTVTLSTEVSPTGAAIAFASNPGAPTLTTSVLFAGGYLSSSSFNSTRSAVLVFPANNEAHALQMTAARIYHTLTPLAGARALIAGGADGDVTLSSAEIFDEAAETFTPTGSMATARSGHAAAPLPDGRVLVTGGLVPDGGGPATTVDGTSEIFDPAAGTFSPAADMTVPRSGHSAIALDDGRVLVLGGNGHKSAEVYDPAGDTFTPVSDMEAVHGLGHRAVKLQDGRVLVTGGDAGTIQPTAVAEVFDPSTDAFTRVGDMTTTRMLHFAVVLDDGTVLVGGGQNDQGDVLATAERFNPATGVFTAVSNMPLPGSEQAAAPVVR